MCNKCKTVNKCGCNGSEVDIKCLFHSGEPLSSLGITNKTLDIFLQLDSVIADIKESIGNITSQVDATCPITMTTTQEVSTYLLTYDCTSETIKLVPAKINKLVP